MTMEAYLAEVSSSQQKCLQLENDLQHYWKSPQTLASPQPTSGHALSYGRCTGHTL